MRKYIVTNYVEVKEVYYIRAESEEEASVFNRKQDNQG